MINTTTTTTLTPICFAWFVVRFFDQEETLRALIPLRQEEDFFEIEESIEAIRDQIGEPIEIDIAPATHRNMQS
jgi:hypothetical protein